MSYKFYKEIAKKHKPLPLLDERRLISLAKKGDCDARQKLLLHLIGFFIFRIETTLFPQIKRDFGDDILQECIVFAEEKIDCYKIRYKNRSGVFKKVFLRSYLWKGVTGVMLNHVKRNSPVSVWQICGRQDVLISNYPAENPEEYDDLWLPAMVFDAYNVLLGNFLTAAGWMLPVLRTSRFFYASSSARRDLISDDLDSLGSTICLRNAILEDFQRHLRMNGFEGLSVICSTSWDNGADLLEFQGIIGLLAFDKLYRYL